MNLQNLRATSAFFLVLVAIGAKASPQLETMRKPVNGLLFAATLQGPECSPQDLLVAFTRKGLRFLRDRRAPRSLERIAAILTRCFFREPRLSTSNRMRREKTVGTSIRSVEVRAQLAALGIVRRATYFTQHANQLFVTQHAQLITVLDRALASAQTNGKS
jgi:hypothetical protein